MKTQSKILLSFICCVVLASCSDSTSNTTDYPTEVRENFISSCVLNAEAQGAEPSKAKESCECAFETIQKDFSFEEYSEAEQAMINGEASEIDFGDIAARCS